MSDDVMDPVLEAQYSLRPRHPEREAVYQAMRDDGCAIRAAHASTMGIRYGVGPRMTLDLFGIGRDAPVVVFIHGGYWRALDKETFSFLAAPLVEAGLTVAMPGYDLAPQTSLAEIEQEISCAARFLAENASRYGYDAGRVVLSGHSAGAQLATMLHLRGPNALGTRGVIGISGVYDLRPLCSTSVGLSIGLNSEAANASSPLDLAHASGGVPGLFAVGGGETEGFRDQSRRFASAWGSMGALSELRVVPETTHFTVLRALFDNELAALVHNWTS